MTKAGVAAPSGKSDVTSEEAIMADPCAEFSCTVYVEVANESVHSANEENTLNICFLIYDSVLHTGMNV